MATKALFNHTSITSEQNLVEDLIIEAIQIYGIDCYYLPKTTSNLDALFGEDQGTTSYNSAYLIEMYVKNVEGFEGQGNFLQQFGLQVEEQVTFTVANSRFENTVTSISRPHEGDLIYFPINGGLFEIQFVEDESIFYQMGKVNVYDLQCEAFAYSNQIINTGVEEIDATARALAIGQIFDLNDGGTGIFTVGETVFQGPTLSGASMYATVKDYSTQGLTTSGVVQIELINISAFPASGVAISGVSSGANWIIAAAPTTNDNLAVLDNGMIGDNLTIETEADNWIDFTEANPFSEEI
jgi:hypothetical protein